MTEAPGHRVGFPDFSALWWDFLLPFGQAVVSDLRQPGTRCGGLVFKSKLPNTYGKRDFGLESENNPKTIELENYIKTFSAEERLKSEVPVGNFSLFTSNSVRKTSKENFSSSALQFVITQD